MSYTNDMASPEIEIAGEASGSFFADSRNKHADLKAMLDGNKDNLKMDAMKRIINISACIQMIAKGKDASDLFPAVVKNVAAKNAELKKLVYVYLMRYAEEQQDLALLSISTFQRALKDPNQLIRASALRVLSSIRVPIIAPIMMLSIKESVRDMSPYVRKVAAHAISKLYSLDPDLKDQLIEVIDQLLADRTTLVLGSAVHAFEEVCPQRIDLIHKHYRKLCQLLVDVDEWGQVVVINMLTRYARTQFLDPNSAESEENGDSRFYSTTDDSESDGERKKKQHKNTNLMDADLRMLLRNTKPLLQSRNSAVVLAVSQLYYYLAPKTEVGIIAKALIRLLRAPREVQSIILTNIATVSANRRSMFEPYLKSFFVRSSDPTHIKLLKTYVATQDKEFAAATIDAIGRCACNIKEVTDVCLSGLVNLLANKNETVVAQSVVVIKKLLQSQPSEHKDIIKQMAKLIDSVKISAARASIVWLIGEYCERVPKVAPDVLRKMAITFAHEDEYVKLQVLNLAVKLYLTNKAQSEKLVQYVFQLAKYDLSYDLRDRARFLRNLILPDKNDQALNRFSTCAKTIFINQKPAPVVESSFKDRDQFQLGTLSHYLNQRCSEYHDLPGFPEVAPDSSVRQVATSKDNTRRQKSRSRQRDGGLESPADISPPLTISPDQEEGKTVKHKEKFYSDEESEEGDEEEDDEDEGSDEEEEEEDDENDEEEESDEEDDNEEDEDEEVEEKRVQNHAPDGKSIESTIPDTTHHIQEQKTKIYKHSKNFEKHSNIDDLLLDLNFDQSTSKAVVMQPTAGIDSSAIHKRPLPGKANPVAEVLQTPPAQYANRTQYSTLLDKISGRGLSVSYLYTRTSSLFSSKMCSIELKISNETEAQIDSLKFIAKKIPHGMDVQGLCQLDNVGIGQSKTLILGVDFADTTQCVTIELIVMPGDYRFLVNLIAPVGEQLEPVVMTRDLFKNLQNRLSGMNETSGKLVLKEGVSMNDFSTFSRAVYQICNVMSVPDVEDKICFAGQTLSAKCPVLISFANVISSVDVNEIRLTVNCEKMVVGSMLFKQLKSDLSKT